MRITEPIIAVPSVCSHEDEWHTSPFTMCEAIALAEAVQLIAENVDDSWLVLRVRQLALRLLASVVIDDRGEMPQELVERERESRDRIDDYLRSLGIERFGNE